MARHSNKPYEAITHLFTKEGFWLLFFNMAFRDELHELSIVTRNIDPFCQAMRPSQETFPQLFGSLWTRRQMFVQSLSYCIIKWHIYGQCPCFDVRAHTAPVSLVTSPLQCIQCFSHEERKQHVHTQKLAHVWYQNWLLVTQANGMVCLRWVVAVPIVSPTVLLLSGIP